MRDACARADCLSPPHSSAATAAMRTTARRSADAAPPSGRRPHASPAGAPKRLARFGPKPRATWNNHELRGGHGKPFNAPTGYSPDALRQCNGNCLAGKATRGPAPLETRTRNTMVMNVGGGIGTHSRGPSPPSLGSPPPPPARPPVNDIDFDGPCRTAAAPTVYSRASAQPTRNAGPSPRNA